jgi:hypothetical protein
MDLNLFVAQSQAKLSSWWQLLSLDDRNSLWAAGGVVLLLVWLWFAFLGIRKACGHKRFRGTWFNEEQFEALIKMIDEDSNRGNRVMRNDEMQLLRRWRFGSAKSVSDRAKGYF